MKRLLTILALAGTTLFLSGCCEELCFPIAHPDCVTTLEYNPVCGCDGVTYGNPSQARCNNIFSFRPGECE